MKSNDLANTLEISAPNSNSADARAAGERVPAKDRPVYAIKLRPEPDVVDPIKALRGFLKDALRRWGLRCIAAVEENHNDR
jgi:hypothetical protein